MVDVNELIKLFQRMWKEHWQYSHGSAKENCVDCSGAFVYAYKVLDNLNIAIHGSNWICRKECIKLLPISEAKPGMAAFKKREPGDEYYALPDKYRKNGQHYNGDLNDYYHIGLIDTDPRYVLNAQSTSTGFVRSPISQKWCNVAYLTRTKYEEDKPMEILYKAKVYADNMKPGTSTVNMREKPTTTSDKVKVLNVGDIVDVYETDGEWAHIKNDGTVGYIMDKFIKKIDDDADEDTDDEPIDDEDYGDEEVILDDEAVAEIEECLQRIEAIIEEHRVHG